MALACSRVPPFFRYAVMPVARNVWLVTAVASRPVGTVVGQVPECGHEEIGELILAHLARGHRELAVLYLAEATDMAVDGNVIGRIGEHHLCFGNIEQPVVGIGCTSSP